MKVPDASDLASLTEDPPMEYSVTVEEGKIEEFADATGDDNAVFRDRSVAATQGFEAVPAPVTFLETDRFEQTRAETYRPDAVLRALPTLHAAQEYEINRAPLAGERLLARRSVEQTYEKDGFSGTLRFAVFETTYETPDGERVVTAHHTRVVTECG